MVSFSRLEVRSARRVRLAFSSALASGAFVPSWYSVTSEDAYGVNPAIVAALAVPNASTDVELVLADDLAPGGLFVLAVAAGVPAADLSTAAAASERFYFGQRSRTLSQEFSRQDLDELLFGVDLVHNGRDFVRGVDGGLATVSGPENAKVAVERRLGSEPLPWNPEYGGQMREYVDAPQAVLPAAVPQLRRQALSDPRVVNAEITVDQDANDGDVILGGSVTLIGKIPVRIDKRVR